MKKIRVYVSTGLVGSKRSMDIEVPDDADADTIEDMARDAMFEMIDWGWNPTDE
jgi:hypothetical protein